MDKNKKDDMGKKEKYIVSEKFLMDVIFTQFMLAELDDRGRAKSIMKYTTRYAAKKIGDIVGDFPAVPREINGEAVDEDNVDEAIARVAATIENPKRRRSFERLSSIIAASCSNKIDWDYE